jgi:urea transport system ATP-binding protein
MLTVTGLNQYYGGSHILRNLAFEVPAGKVTVLLGRNGVGKTTLLKSLMGLVPVKSGAITMCRRGVIFSPGSPWRKISKWAWPH